MAIRTDSPQLAALLLETERIYGHPVKSPTDFVLLADRIETNTGEHISDSTIKRLWKPALAYKTVSERTLNVISQYAGYLHYKAFLTHLAELGQFESEMISGEDSVRSSDLKTGDMVRIAWQPDRECLLRYLGDRKFMVEDALHSKIQNGDSFFCSIFIKGRPLYVDNLCHNGEMYESYGMGTEHGLSSVVVFSGI